MTSLSFSWIQIVRLGLVQTALGAVVVLMTSTINRVMVVELALPAMVPGALVALHYAVQILRPRWGYGSDRGGRRTPWIVGGMAALALGGFGAAAATALCETNVTAGLVLAVLSFLSVGMGAGAAGTSLLVLLATGVDDHRRGAAATVVWVMMIVGFAVTAPLAGHYLDPFSGARLMAVSGTVSAIAFIVAVLAVAGIEPARSASGTAKSRNGKAFSEVLKRVWAEPISRRFTIFIFVSMLAYSAQELILEPYAGLIFEMTPGATTKLSGLQHGGVLAGMLMVAGITMGIGGPIFGSLKLWTAIGCLGSAVALAAIAAGGPVGAAFPLRQAVFALGLSNGVYAVAAIGSMMGLAGQGGEAERGTRMGVWGAAQGIAFGAGGFLGTAAVDLARLVTADPTYAYASVFAGEAVLFVGAALIAMRIEHAPARARRANPLMQAAAYQLDPAMEAR
ncbi:BCD family MFS transporter [Methylobacterium haplocladii]|uniref:Bacteriochlorophyll synthase n=1 Tax=Methylobacterium haplocladii TaxID=1176176 RepID=A0A512IR54_9HYPH|nr:BCD family MFS transporter [Methylobacterium haplocladii]GEP00099.1 bacteriochlorophyll synthase [Methylobacterium haplocladii]GJD85351.1 Protein PucC [Methylobacterium haplocladii]